MTKAACIIKPHNAGLWSLINKVATCDEIYGASHVDWREGHIYHDHGQGNLWDILFENNPPPAEAAGIVTEYPHQKYTFDNVAALYNGDADPAFAWRQRLHEHYRRWSPQLAHAALVRQYIKREFRGRPYVAAIIRAEGHAGEQTTRKSQTLEQYREAIKAEQKRISKATGHYCELFLMAGDWQTLHWFEHSGLLPHYYQHTHRSPDRSRDYHLSEKQTAQDAVNCLVEVMIAAQAKTLVHPVSNMATGALYINPTTQSIYIP